MEGPDLIGEISKCVPIASSKFSGDLDASNLRTNTGDEQWPYQRYQGQFMQDSIHGRGKYSWTHERKWTVYEGQFYASNLEGYGKFSYSDSSMFEGLFKNNYRYGPGVFTYTNGTQDVGLWMGKDLVRLCCVVKPQWVPRLAKTPPAKVKLIRFKKLVSVCNGVKDRAKDILEKLDVSEKVMRQSDKLYNIHIRNPKSHFFNTTLYDDAYFCKKDCYIEVALTPEEEIDRQQEELALQEEKYLNKIESEDVSEGQGRMNSFSINTDGTCICEDPKQIRIQELRLQLDHTEEVLARMTTEINKAKYRKILSKSKTTPKDEIRKSVGWERIEVLGGSSTTIEHSVYDDDFDVQDLELDPEELSECEECDLEDEAEINYATACKLLTAAQNAEKLLLLKKEYLTKKIDYETTTETEIETIELETNQCPTKKILVTDLLAWNNEKTSTEILKHVFLHRNFEKDISYCVTDLLTGDRSQFRDPGAYERECMLFLKYCSKGNVKEAMELLRNHDLNPDLCDAKGNTGIIYATARDRTRVIRTLVNCGANLDIFNDECFTPLGMCVTRYLAVQQDITDWESAFLRSTLIQTENEEKETREWRPHVSLTSINTIIQANFEKSEENVSQNKPSTRQASHARLEALSELFGSNLDIIHTNFVGSFSDVQNRLSRLKSLHDFQDAYFQKISTETPQPYILNTDCIKPPPGKKENTEKDKKNKKDKASKANKALKKSESIKLGENFPEMPISKDLHEVSLEDFELKTVEILRNNKLNAIYDTITTLLKYGADPNMCEVPMPTLIIAVFSKSFNLIEDLLLAKANPNVINRDDGLTPLHVVVSLPPCEEHIQILKLLLNYSADPNCRTSVHHWLEQKRELAGNYILEEEDEGKTPLHLLSMRYDFVLDNNEYLNQMVPILMEHGGKVTVRYLGHTPLSLAIMRGNVKLIKTLLNTKRINPNQTLGEKMGVPLTLFILKRYKDVLPDIKTCQNIIQLLLDYKANPFNTIEEFGNSIDFMMIEHEEPPKLEKKSKTSKEKNKGKNKSKASDSKKENKGRKGKIGANVQEEVKKFLVNAAKIVLEKHLKGYIVKYLYFFVKDQDYYDDVSVNMAKFLTPAETVAISQLLFHRGEIPIDTKTNYDVTYDLIEFIINMTAQPNAENVPPSSFVDIDEMLKDFDFNTMPTEPGKLNLLEPEAEKHSEKYIVCFHCYRKKNLQLFICPECLVVYFCSQECNKLSNKEKHSIHKCGTLFYSDKKAIHDERLTRADHWKRTSEIRKNLQEIIEKEGWVLETPEDYKRVKKRYIKADPKRRLHLTRKIKSATLETYQDEDFGLSKSEIGLSKSEIALKRKQQEKEGGSILSLRWRKEASEFLFWKKSHDTKGKSKGRRSSRKGRKGGHGRESSGSIESGGKGRHGGKGGHGGKDEHGGEGRHGGTGRGKGHGGAGEDEGEEEIIKHEGRGGKDKRRGEGRETETKGEEFKSGVKSEGRTTVAGLAITGTGSLDFGAVTDQYGFSLFPPGGKILELQRRLPSRYQYFLQKISELWPDFDLSMVFLPYACYSNGQLYYRFLSNEPVFMETYSSN